MNWDLKNRLPEALVGGAAGLVVVATYIVARTYIEGADAGDWLNFAGVIFGVMLTAGVTIGIQHYADHQKLRPFRQRLLHHIDGLEQSVLDIGTGGGEHPGKHITDIVAMIDEVRNMDFELARDVQHHVVEFNEAMRIVFGYTMHGEPELRPLPERDLGISSAKAIIRSLKKRVR